MTWQPKIVSAPSPNHGGIRPETRGCVIHATYGGAKTPVAELAATLAWFKAPASQVSAHVVIDLDGTIYRVVGSESIAWHAREYNAHHLGAELVKQNKDSHITDEQLRSLAWQLKAWSEDFGFTLSEANLPEHRQIPPGVAEGKEDVGPDYYFARLAPFLS